MKKKTIKVPFNIKKAKAGAKVVTSTGMDVRIICFDRTGSKDCPHISNYPIVGLLMTETGNELIQSFTANGKFCLDEDNSSFDLFKNEEVEEEDPKFEPFQKVLVRDIDTQVWRPSLFSHYDNESAFKFAVVGNSYIQCIPYEGNEDLCFTNNSPK